MHMSHTTACDYISTEENNNYSRAKNFQKMRLLCTKYTLSIIHISRGMNEMGKLWARHLIITSIRANCCNNIQYSIYLNSANTVSQVNVSWYYGNISIYCCISSTWFKKVVLKELNDSIFTLIVSLYLSTGAVLMLEEDIATSSQLMSALSVHLQP